MPLENNVAVAMIARVSKLRSRVCDALELINGVYCFSILVSNESSAVTIKFLMIVRYRLWDNQSARSDEFILKFAGADVALYATRSSLHRMPRKKVYGEELEGSFRVDILVVAWRV